MTPDEYIQHYTELQKQLKLLIKSIAEWNTLRDTVEEKLTKLALGNSASLTPLKDGLSIVHAGATFYIEGDVMADVYEGQTEIVITLFALNVHTGAPTTLHLSPQPGKDWDYAPEPSQAHQSVEAFLAASAAESAGA